ncbi:MAG: molybdopterin-dependent oxidoreductase, partial [Polaromonas sp.]|nr:molybdopterin-dependent oxidoreductase [Polaromonas sp.]
MTRRADESRSRADFHAAVGVLLVKRTPPLPVQHAPGQPPTVQANPLEGDEVLLAVWDDGSVTALHGHVDLGTGIATALTQIVAEELYVELSQVNMVLGNTASVPNQGATIASASLQIHAAPLRAAAAQARAWLLARAAAKSVAPTDYAALLAGHVELSLNLNTPLKAPADYRIVGTSAPRTDIPAKVTGALTFVHDMRVPGMLHGRVVRPPYVGADHGDFIGNTLASVDDSSIAHIPGIRAVVVIRDFVGIVAEREEHVDQALRELRVQWKPWPGMPDQSDLAEAIRQNRSTQRRLVEEGNVDMAMASADQKMPRNYVWPYQLHASIGPSCALADWQGAVMTVWAGSQNPHVLRADLAKLMDLPDTQINIIRMEAAGCYGRNCADDVAADAALLSRAVGAPVRVQLTREQESAWEPKGAAQLMQVNGGLNADGTVAAYDFQTSYPSNASPTLALLLTRTIEPVTQAFEMGDRTARPPYDYANLRVAVNDMAPLVRASWLRGVSALPNSFAHESYIDELATAAGVDPVEFRLRYLQDPRAVELLKATADKAGWQAHASPQTKGPQGDILSGQGVGYARYNHSKWPGFGAAWAAWVADVEVNRRTGEVHVRRVVVGHDAGTLINPAGVQHQIHGNVVQTTSRALLEEVKFNPQSANNPGTVANLEWGSYPILNFRDVPVIDIVTMPRPGEPPLGAGESSSVPGTAAIANAIFDATGVRFRQPPFTPEVVLAGLAEHEKHGLGYKNELQPNEYEGSQLLNKEHLDQSIPASATWLKQSKRWLQAGGVLAGLFGLAVALVGWRSVIAPVPLAAANVYSPATIERGRQLAALGNCVGCHTATDGVSNSGGRALGTPFGKIYSTNLTPDSTGIGNWSLLAFQRAMREGISRDGQYLYPAFPYTSYAKTTDEDLTALYAYLMAQPAVQSTPPVTKLAFPYNIRPLMAVWNGLFHDPSP